MTIKEEFNTYRKMVIPATAPLIQVIECQKAFYSGALAFYSIVMQSLDPGKEPTDDDLNRMRILHNELVTYAKSIMPKTN